MRESKFLEYKEDISNSFLKTVSAFSNFSGGEIRFGIKDNGDIIGIENPIEACQIIENKINDSIEPKAHFRLEVDDKTNVITLTVLEGLEKPYFYKSRAYKRNDSSTIKVEPYELRRLILEGQNKTFESLVARNQVLSFNYLEKSLKAEMGLEKISDDVMITLELYNSKEGYNQAAELLADDNSFHGIDAARFGDSINIILDRETFYGISILEQFEKIMTMYRKYYQYEKIKGASRIRVEKIPEEAFREAIANALIHRCWDMEAHIRVAMYEDYVEVTSPGGLPKGLTKEEYLQGQVSILRNPIIGNVFFRLHHIERFGTGVRRINNAYTSSEVKPKFEVFENSIKVVLPVIREQLSVSEDEKIVYRVFTGNRKLTSSQVVNLTGFGKTKVYQLLKSMVEQGYIRVEGQGRATRYYL